MAEPVTAKLLSAIPARDHDQVIPYSGAVKHPQDDHASPAFAIIALDRPARTEVRGPSVVHCLGVGAIRFQIGKGRVNVRAVGDRAARDGMFRPAVRQDLSQLLQGQDSRTRQ